MPNFSSNTPTPKSPFAQLGNQPMDEATSTTPVRNQTITRLGEVPNPSRMEVGLGSVRDLLSRERTYAQDSLHRSHAPIPSKREQEQENIFHPLRSQSNFLADQLNKGDLLIRSLENSHTSDTNFPQYDNAQFKLLSAEFIHRPPSTPRTIPDISNFDDSWNFEVQTPFNTNQSSNSDSSAKTTWISNPISPAPTLAPPIDNPHPPLPSKSPFQLIDDLTKAAHAESVYKIRPLKNSHPSDTNFPQYDNAQFNLQSAEFTHRSPSTPRTIPDISNFDGLWNFEAQTPVNTNQSSNSDSSVKPTWISHPFFPTPTLSQPINDPQSLLPPKSNPRLIDDILKAANAESVDEIRSAIFRTALIGSLADDTKKIVLSYAIAQKMDNAVARSLEYLRPDINSSTNGFTPLMLSAYFDNARAAELLIAGELLERTADFDLKPHYLSHIRPSPTIKLDVDARNPKGQTALTMWIENGNANVVSSLISRGAIFSESDFDLASNHERAEIVNLLINSIPEDDPEGLLSLQKWIAKGNLFMVQALLSNGIPVGKFDLDLAAENNDLPILRAFMISLRERSILAINYLQNNHPQIATLLQDEANESSWGLLNVITSSMKDSLKATEEFEESEPTSSGPSSATGNPDSQLTKAIEEFEKSKDFEHLGSMAQSLVHFAHQHPKQIPSVTIRNQWDKI